MGAASVQSFTVWHQAI